MLKKQRNKNFGIVMIEVLISISITTLVFLSLLIYQINMSEQTERTYLQTIAFSQLENFSEMLLANQKDSVRQTLLMQWNNNNANFLPQGQGSFVDNDDYSCDVTLQWFFKKQETETIETFC